jgi:hypothetical protein
VACTLDRLAGLDTDTLVDLYALIGLAVAHGSPVLAINYRDREGLPINAPMVSWADIGRRRGWLDLTKHRRHPRLRESINLLTSVRLRFSLYEDLTLNAPRLLNLGEIERPGRSVGCVVQFNQLLWDAMTDRRRAVPYDRAILAADLSH